MRAEEESDPRQFFLALKVQWVFGHRYVECPHCDQRLRRSIVPHLRNKHESEWNAAVRDWHRRKNLGHTYRRIMGAYTRQEGQYILSWTVIRNEVKAFAERESRPILGRPRLSTLSWKPASEVRPDTTVWSFARRGSWAVHSPDYEGNWSPFIPRELIRQYSRKGDLVLDAFVGGGTTLIECALLGRRALGIDISPHAVAHSQQRLNELRILAAKALDPPLELSDIDSIQVRQGDARELEAIDENSIDFICTHPPYGSAIRYTHGIEGDLSLLDSQDDFDSSMEEVAMAFFRVLKPNGYCAILIGDNRENGEVKPLGFRILQIFTTKCDFRPVEVIIKLQHQDNSTEFYFGKKSRLRYRIAHEYLFIFRKPARDPRHV